MADLATRGMGWQCDLPDLLDYTASHNEVQQLTDNLKRLRKLPDYVDWREYCEGVDDQSNCNTSSAHACVGLLQYYERRATGRIIDPSRLFVYKTARRLLNCSGDNGASLRATWKAIVRFGTASERIWPFDPQKLDAEPDAFAYSFDNQYSSIRYVRLDAVGKSGQANLLSVKRFLAAGFACVFGFPVYDSIRQYPDIDFPSITNRVLGGQAVMAVGYDDKRRYRSEKGALLIRNSWGEAWGEAGYGWLPYSYLCRNLASDFWSILSPEWLSSGEFYQPAVDSTVDRDYETQHGQHRTDRRGLSVPRPDRSARVTK